MTSTFMKMCYVASRVCKGVYQSESRRDRARSDQVWGRPKDDIPCAARDISTYPEDLRKRSAFERQSLREPHQPASGDSGLMIP